MPADDFTGRQQVSRVLYQRRVAVVALVNRACRVQHTRDLVVAV